MHQDGDIMRSLDYDERMHDLIPSFLTGETLVFGYPVTLRNARVRLISESGKYDKARNHANVVWGVQSPVISIR